MSWKPSSHPNRAQLALLFGVIGFLASLPYRTQLHTGLNDEGIVLQAAWRIVSGEVPYRDFDLLYTPVSMMGVAFWFKIFGVTIESARWLMTVTGGLLGALIFLISSKLLKQPHCFVPPVLFALSGYSEWPVISYHWYSIAALLCGLVCLLEWYDEQNSRWIFAAGIAVGLAGACLQSEGVSGFFGVATALTLAAGKGKWKARLVDFLKFLGGIAVVWIPLVLYLIYQGALASFVDNTILRVLSGLYVNHGAPYDLSKHVFGPWSHFAGQWPSSWTGARVLWVLETLTVLFTWTLKYALFFPVILGTAYLGFRRRNHWIGASLFLLFWLLVARERLDLLYSNYLMPLWYVGLIGLIEFTEEKASKVGKVLLGLVAVLYSATILVTWKYSESFIYPVQTPRGVLWSNNLPMAETSQALYSTAEKLTPPGSKTFAWPFGAGFSFLAGVSNPTRLDFLVPGWQDTKQTEQVLETLVSEEVEYVYYFPLSDEVLLDYPYVDPQEFSKGLSKNLDIIGTKYQKIGQVGHLQVFQRK